MKKIVLTLLFFASLSAYAQVGIGVAAADVNASAQLEVKSTNKGFLPPRMTSAQRDAISSPATGLVLWCSDCGTAGELEVFNGDAWINLVDVVYPASQITGTVTVYNGGTGKNSIALNNVLLGNGTNAIQEVAPGASGNILTSNGTTWVSQAPSSGGGQTTHTVGESFGGGIVFYVTTDGLHGLIAETIDQSSSSTGVEAQNKISDPNNHSANGKLYTDWRLPTRWELLKLLDAKSLGYVTGFNGDIYFSSIGYYSDAYLWVVHFSTGGYEDLVNKYNSSNYVRAIRSF